MKRAVSLFLVALAVLATAQQTPTTPAAKEADVKTMDAAIASVYDVISGPAGKKRDWDRIRSLFTPDARMMAVVKNREGKVQRRVMTVEDYIKTSGPFLEERGFFEKEVARRVETFGNIAHVFSTYEARQKLEDEKPMMRGINSIQLWNDGTRWWVLTIYWQAEDGTTPLPEKYLKSGG